MKGVTSRFRLTVQGWGVGSRIKGSGYRLGGPPNPVLVTIRDNNDYVKVLLDSCYTTITGWGVHLRSKVDCLGFAV